ncbi:MAG TPA: hypothetical protein VH142_20455 [Polyangiaceae bacterium]|nr:hypothetical protein [Polyangiaceae bacterium]
MAVFRVRSVSALVLLGSLGCSSGGEHGAGAGERRNSGGTDASTPSSSGASGGASAAGGATGSSGGVSGSTSSAGASGTPGTGGVAGASGSSGASGSGGSANGSGGATNLDGGAAPRVSPWGIASSASSSRALGSWAPAIRATGITWLRGFDASNTDMNLTIAATNGLDVSGILIFSGPGASQTFPVADPTGWSNYVTTSVTQCKGRVHDWEVWNEPPNFTDDKTPTSYATIVKSGYDAAKAVDSTVQIGLAAQSNHVNWLEQTILAGGADHFDYVTVHPYEILGLVASGFEGEYMAVVPTIRKMLAKDDPARASAPVWFTEIGEPVDGSITAEHQAETVVKAYTMGIAEGVEHVHWFEGIDGDSGPFGLIDASGRTRPSYAALATLISKLGQFPDYVGWVLLNDRDYGFVFDGTSSTVLVTWTPPGATDTVAMSETVAVIEASTGTTTNGTSVSLTNSPSIVSGDLASLKTTAAQNRRRPFPWGGDFSTATAVSYRAGSPDAGLHPLTAATLVTVDGGPARDESTSYGVSFAVDPNFLSYTTTPVTITAVVRANGAGAAGFNLKYESTSGSSSTGSWYGVPGSDQWYTQTWTITDDQFVGKWGYNFTFDSDSTDNSNYSIQSVTVAKK